MKHCNLKVIYWPIYQLNTSGYKKALIIDLFWLSLVWTSIPYTASHSVWEHPWQCWNNWAHFVSWWIKMNCQIVPMEKHLFSPIFRNNWRTTSKFYRNFLPPDTHTYVCISGGKKCSFFGKFGVLCFLETPVLRFALLSYYRRNRLWYILKVLILKNVINQEIKVKMC